MWISRKERERKRGRGGKGDWGFRKKRIEVSKTTMQKLPKRPLFVPISVLCLSHVAGGGAYMRSCFSVSGTWNIMQVALSRQGLIVVCVWFVVSRGCLGGDC